MRSALHPIAGKAGSHNVLVHTDPVGAGIASDARRKPCQIQPT
jgi:hypothetical protein